MGLGRHENTGCFLIGNGPSLQNVDVSRLAHVDTFAFNRSYVAWSRWGFAPTYYACLDPVGFEDNVSEIKKLIETCSDTHFFLPKDAEAYGIYPSATVSCICTVEGFTFATDVSTPTDFGNVGATSIQILSLLGYCRIAMVGMDGRYIFSAEMVAAAENDGFANVESDPNHFCAEYVQGKRLNTRCNLEKMAAQWQQVASECARIKMEIRNASSGSALAYFPMCGYPEAIKWIEDNRAVRRLE